MAMETWVVGDRFATFAELGGVQTYTALRADLTAARVNAGASGRRCIRIGQGLNLEEITELESIVADPQVAPAFTLAHVASARRCNPRLVHKRHARNVMLSTPTIADDNVFMASLCLDDDCDELADHLTGHHLQGTVLAEAARQAVLAVSEAFLLPETKRFAMRFVTKATEFNYHTYAFPLAVRLRFTVEAIKRGAGGNFAATAALAFEQNGAKVADGRFRFTALDGEFVDANETELARQAIGASP